MTTPLERRLRREKQRKKHGGCPGVCIHHSNSRRVRCSCGRTFEWPLPPVRGTYHFMTVLCPGCTTAHKRG
jgi:hypothetical protein